MTKSCGVVGCRRAYYALGWCNMHWERVRKHGDPHAGRNHAPPDVRFWRYVKKLVDGCWLWTAKVEKTGYGRFQVGGKGSAHVSVHRFSYVMAYGKIPAGKIVMHKCDNRICVRPDHLKLGTHRENSGDMRDKGRSLPGVRNPNAKITDDIVRAIRKTAPGTRGLVKRFGIAKETIARIRKRQSWQHVED